MLNISDSGAHRQQSLRLGKRANWRRNGRACAGPVSVSYFVYLWKNDFWRQNIGGGGWKGGWRERREELQMRVRVNERVEERRRENEGPIDWDRNDFLNSFTARLI